MEYKCIDIGAVMVEFLHVDRISINADSIRIKL